MFQEVGGSIPRPCSPHVYKCSWEILNPQHAVCVVIVPDEQVAPCILCHQCLEKVLYKYLPFKIRFRDKDSVLYSYKRDSSDSA